MGMDTNSASNVFDHIGQSESKDFLYSMKCAIII